MKQLLPRFLIGLSLLGGGMWSVAVLNAQTSNDPKEKEKEKDKNVAKAETLFQQGKVEESYKVLEKAVEGNPSLPPARLMMARMLLGNEKTVQAGRQLLEVAIAENPDHPEVYLTNGSIALAEGRVTDTLLNCRIALQLSEADRWTAAQRRIFQKEARAGLATSFEARKDWTSARTQFVAWVELDPKNGQLRQRLARCLFLSGKMDDAFTELLAAKKDETADAKMDPPEVTMALLYASIVGTEDKKKNPGDDYTKKAEEWFQKAIAKDAKSARVHQAYAGWLLDTGNPTLAKEHIDKAESLEGKSPSRETKALVGLYERYKGNYGAAEKLFEDIYRLAPGDFFSSNQLALVLFEQDDKPQQSRALQLAEVNARQYPRSAEAFATLGWGLFKAGREDEADRALGMAINSGQASPDTAYYLAKLLFKKEKYWDAKQVLDKAMDSKGVFVNRDRAKKFQTEVNAKAPAKDPNLKEDPKAQEKEKEKDKEPVSPK